MHKQVHTHTHTAIAAAQQQRQDRSLGVAAGSSGNTCLNTIGNYQQQQQHSDYPQPYSIYISLFLCLSTPASLPSPLSPSFSFLLSNL
jgi:hypothetical protein